MYYRVHLSVGNNIPLLRLIVFTGLHMDDDGIHKIWSTATTTSLLSKKELRDQMSLSFDINTTNIDYVIKYIDCIEEELNELNVNIIRKRILLPLSLDEEKPYELKNNEYYEMYAKIITPKSKILSLLVLHAKDENINIIHPYESNDNYLILCSRDYSDFSKLLEKGNRFEKQIKQLYKFDITFKYQLSIYDSNIMLDGY